VEPFIQKNPEINHEPLEIEQLVKLGNARGPCPFYLAREMARTADLIFMPYNYLIDSKNRSGLSMLSLENSVLIFDEAHNVEVHPPFPHPTPSPPTPTPPATLSFLGTKLS
jgi:regulator of telomere elongation helicase 1